MKILTNLERAINDDLTELQNDYQELKHIIKKYLKISIDNNAEV